VKATIRLGEAEAAGRTGFHRRGETIGDSDALVVHLIAKSQVLRCCGTIGLRAPLNPEVDRCLT